MGIEIVDELLRIVEKARILLFNPGKSLYRRAISSGFWAFILRIVRRGFSFVRTIILARLLAPEDFGLMGIALLSISALDTFSRTGFQDALIQKDEDIDEYLDIAWTVSLLRGFLICIILFFSAPAIARFFGTPAALSIIRVLSLSELLKGMKNVGVIYFQKELEFNKQFFYEFTGAIVDLIVSITMALLLHSVWALAFGLLARNLVSFILSYFIHPYRPRIKLEKRKAFELYSFGKWVFASGILFFLVTHGDDIFLGRVMGVTALGLYQMAYRIAELPVTEITNVVKRVTFPAFSKVQSDTEKLKMYFKQTLETTAVAIFPLSIGLLILGPDIIDVFLGDEWLDMVPALQVLALYGLIQSISASAGTLFRAVGHPEIGFYMNAIRFIAISVTIYPFTNNLGILGAALSIGVGAIVKIPIFLLFNKRYINISVSELWKTYENPFYITIVAGFITIILQYFVNQSGLTFLIAESVCFIFVFISVSFILWRINKKSPFSIIKLLNAQLQRR